MNNQIDNNCFCVHSSILGMNLFGCKFCEVLPDGIPKCWRKNFDSLLWAIITVFQVILTLSTFTSPIASLSPVHTGDYSRQIRRLSPKTATVAEFGDNSRQCGQGFSCNGEDG